MITHETIQQTLNLTPEDYQAISGLLFLMGVFAGLSGLCLLLEGKD